MGISSIGGLLNNGGAGAARRAIMSDLQGGSVGSVWVVSGVCLG